MCEGEPKQSAATFAAIYVQRVAASDGDESVEIKLSTSPHGQACTTRALPDTGSQLDAIPQSLYQSSFSDIPLLPGATARTAIGNAINCLGSFSATIDWTADDGISYPIVTTLHVLEDLQQTVLCSATQRKLGMLHTKYPHARINTISSTPSHQPSDAQKEADLSSLMAEFPRVFDGVCRVMTGPHVILFSRKAPSRLRFVAPARYPNRSEFPSVMNSRPR